MCIAHQDTIQKLTKNLASTPVTLESLGVKKAFHLDEAERAELLGHSPHQRNSNSGGIVVDKFTETKSQLT